MIKSKSLHTLTWLCNSLFRLRALSPCHSLSHPKHPEKGSIHGENTMPPQSSYQGSKKQDALPYMVLIYTNPGILELEASLLYPIWYGR